MAEAVYTFCALASLACAVLLQRGWRQSRVRLLMWSAACFWLLALNNMLLFVDLVISQEDHLLVPRGIAGLAGPVVLLAGLIWDVGRRHGR